MSRFVWWIISNFAMATLLYVCISMGSPVAQYIIVSVAVLELSLSVFSLQNRVVGLLAMNPQLLPTKYQSAIEYIVNAALIATFVVDGWWFTAGALMISTTLNISILSRAQQLSGLDG